MDSRLKLILNGDPEEELMLLIRLKDAKINAPFCTVITQFGDIITCRVIRKHLLEIYNSPDTFSVKAPRLIPAPLQKEETELISAAGVSNPSRRFKTPYTGKGVYFGTVDWGFDFAHSNLRNPDGSTKFKCIWDQNGPYDNNGYGYGCFYSHEQINQALQTDTPYQTLGYHPGATDILGAGMHGTHVIDIATGTPMVGEGGVAPEATYIGVQLGNNFVNGSDLALGDSVRLVEGLHFIRTAAQDALCVINMSLGSHGDSHTGKSLVEIAMDNFLSNDNGYAVVQSVGNYFIANCHLQYIIKQGETYNIALNIPRINSSPNEVEIWYPGSDHFSLRLIAPDGEMVADTEPFEDIQISYCNNPVGYIFHRSKEPNTGLNHIDIILDVSILKGKWIIQVIGTKVSDGAFNAYIERNDASQAKFSSRQSSSYTTTGSVCNGKQTITVGAYDHNDRLKPVVRFSSSGPTVTGQSKPDLLAPGYKILAARSAPAASAQPTNGMTVKSGSSMAAPHVAGSLILLFQKCLPQRLSIEKTKQLLFKSLDPLPPYFPTSDHIRAGNGFLNINQLLDQTQSFKMDTSYITRPVRKLQDSEEMEDLAGEQEYHAPYLHQNCQQCDDMLLENIDEGSLENEPELLNALNETNEEDIDPFALYRHFHPRYQYDDSAYKKRFTPVALPNKHFADTFKTGDVVLLRRVLSGKTYQAIITDPALLTNENLNGYSSDSKKPGYYVQAYGNINGDRNEKTYLRIAGRNNVVPDNLIVLRTNKNLPEDIAESDLPEDTSDYKEYKLQYVKYGKGAGYMYAGDKSINYADIFKNSGFSDLENKMAKHFLETEGGIDSINTYDNQIITWGFGFAGKSGNFTIALYDLLSTNSAANNDFNFFGITLTSAAKNNLSISSDTQLYNGDNALSFWKLSKKYLNILISLTQKYAQDAFAAQWRTFKKIHRQVFTAFEDSSYLGNISTDLEKNKAKTAVLHAHHHYPGFNPPRTFKDASTFEEVLRIYVNQSSKHGSVQGHANAWRISINRIFSNNVPVPVPPMPVPPSVPVPPVSNTSKTVLSGSVGKGGQNIAADVTKVQQLLNNAGIVIPVTGQIDNNEGDATILAIYHYQKKKKLPAYDGKVDVNGSTIKTLLKESGALTLSQSRNEAEEQVQTRPTLRFGARGKNVIYLQERLNYHNINLLEPLKEDGIWMEKTQKAVLFFQTTKELVVDGIVGPKTWAALDADYIVDPGEYPLQIPPDYYTPPTFPPKIILVNDKPPDIHTIKLSLNVSNRYISEAIQNCIVEFIGNNFTAKGKTGSSGNLILNIEKAPDGVYLLKFTPLDNTSGPVGPKIITTKPRLYRVLKVNVTLKAGHLIDVNVKINNGEVSINNNIIIARIQPVWMSSPNHSLRSSITLDHCVLHHTGSTIESTINTFLGKANQVSAHYVINTDGQAVKMVNESEVSNHAGTSHWAGKDNVNSFSVGIEIVHQSGVYPSVQIKGLITLLTLIVSKFADIKPFNIIGHSDIATCPSKTCPTVTPRQLGRKSGDPGATFPWHIFAAVGFSRPIPFGPPSPFLYGGVFHKFPTIIIVKGDQDKIHKYGGKSRPAITSHVIQELQTDLNTIGYFCPVTSMYDKPTNKAVEMFQEHFISMNNSSPLSGKVDLITANTIKLTANL